MMLLVASHLALAISVQAAPSVAPAQAPSSVFPNRGSEFRMVAEEFIAAAAAGDSVKVTQMLSTGIKEKTGASGVQRYVAGQLLPFFATFKELAKTVTVTPTAGVTGFAFYMYGVMGMNELRPFVIYVTEEDGRKMVANILVDRFVEGRHCTPGAGGWKCPDFSDTRP